MLKDVLSSKLLNNSRPPFLMFDKSWFFAIAHWTLWQKHYFFITCFWHSWVLTFFVSLLEIPYFHLMSWCESFLERHNFRVVLGESPETMRKLCLSTKFPHQEIRWNYSIFRSVHYQITHNRKCSRYHKNISK